MSRFDDNVILEVKHIIAKKHNGRVIAEFERILGKDKVEADTERIASETDNTLGLHREVRGIVYPADTEDVVQIIRLANALRVPLYPVSRGRNMGYGNKAPVSNGQIIVDLQRMNTIRKFDNEQGYVDVEPGVTQGQLYQFLNENHSNFWMDATGAGNEASIVGNTLEGGFGHTPNGNHRDMVSDVEIVLGNGTVLKTGTFPGIGPDLAPLFIQSGFGIVTSMRVELFRIPEKYESFLIKIDDPQQLNPLVDMLSRLRHEGTLTSLVHIANATRSLITTSKCPGEYADTLISCDTARKIMSSPFLRSGYWNAIGGLYGTKREVAARKKELKKKLRAIGKILFFSDEKLKWTENITRTFMPSRSATRSRLLKNLAAYGTLHGLMKGCPSDEPLKNIKWRVEKDHDMGLIWFSPTLSASENKVENFLNITETVFKKYRFEMPVTFTLIKPNQIVAVFSISFNKKNEEEKQRAHQLHKELNSICSANDIRLYRSGIIGMADLAYGDTGKQKTLVDIKNCFDPNHIISPGRYGL